MELPALRQPKSLNVVPIKTKIQDNSELQYVILTLKDSTKLVIPSDSYHGIIIASEVYKCVFCNTIIEFNNSDKEFHKCSSFHRKTIEMFPHIEEFSNNLVRKLNKDEFYCTICNVIVTSVFLKRHTSTEAHSQELNKAIVRASTYKPTI